MLSGPSDENKARRKFNQRNILPTKNSQSMVQGISNKVLWNFWKAPEVEIQNLHLESIEESHAGHVSY